eukprot:CAMPEP_0168427126 /NCGR_PEP_ID=MMETSP0228-20121227/36189_1 /TAXON_ID=133427 /ORGANISM="Protoceratium reticulatum, Strain CCCM 535 (=CCMP 1889)" /LENGTH=61 /DNA_ID=CAMNT_0008441161 /DNA_START=83 /DNA_END=265 /DNA_ORIENTATION=-
MARGAPIPCIAATASSSMGRSLKRLLLSHVALLWILSSPFSPLNLPLATMAPKPDGVQPRP